LIVILRINRHSHPATVTSLLLVVHHYHFSKVSALVHHHHLVRPHQLRHRQHSVDNRHQLAAGKKGSALARKSCMVWVMNAALVEILIDRS
jgi:hypothetical protein